MSKVKRASIEPKMRKANKKKYKSKELESVNVEEIENGFLIRKEYKVTYSDDKHDYGWETEKYFSKTNPLSINLDETPLADKF